MHGPDRPYEPVFGGSSLFPDGIQPTNSLELPVILYSCLLYTSTKEQAVFNCSRVALMVSSMMSGNFKALSVAMQDEIHQPYRKILIPGMEYLLKKAVELGCYGGYLSGAGPTLMLVFPKGQDVCGEMQDIVKGLKNFWLVKPIQIDKNGATVEGLSLIHICVRSS